MKVTGRKFPFALLALALVVTLPPIAGAAAFESAATTQESPTTILYLVRHAEVVPPPYEESPPDPPLRERGMARAAALSRVLAAEPIDAVYSTDYNRTRETAAVVADGRGLELTLYDPRDLDAFAERLRGLGGRHLIVGHSNTTPMVVEALGGDPGEPIVDEWEFDRLYVVTLHGDGSVTTVQLRYGPISTDPEGR